MNTKSPSRSLPAMTVFETPSMWSCALAFFAFAPMMLNAQTVSDVDISEAIEREYLYDDAVPFNRVNVHSENGIVTLTGLVPNLAASTQAAALASVVRGVRAVVNQIDVQPDVIRSREEIEEALVSALSMDPATDHYEIDVSVDMSGVATLRGATDSWAERWLTETVASTVAGVTRVVNEITVDAGLIHRGPGEVSNEISERLRWDVRIDDSLVNVLVRDGGRVILSGTVGSAAEKQHAQELAWVNGVSEVDASALTVERWARDDDLRRDKYEHAVTDAEIERSLQLALRYDPRVLPDSVTTRVDNGVVWLSGEVENLAARRAAERDATNTVGVRRVHNHLRLSRDGRLDDATIETHARDVLAGRGLLRDSIHLSIDDGRAMVEGDVDSIVEYWQTLEALESIKGIEELHNSITVRNQYPRFAMQWYGAARQIPMPGPYYPGSRLHAKTDRELREDVESELFWSPFIDLDDVMLDVDNGAVTLSGSVGTQREADAAVMNAYEAGAFDVHDQLVVENM